LADSFFTELKRRNVFKVGAAYLVLAWVILQITDTAVPALHLPEWIITAVFFFGAIGFPFAIFFAWAFEITPEGIKKESDIAPEDSIASHTGRKLDFAIIGLLVLGMGYFIYESRFKIEQQSQPKAIVTEETTNIKETTQKAKGTSIAVLPFINMSSDKEQEYFSDGISEEILNVLAKIPKLQVTSRSSAFSYKGTKINISEVAKVLGVKNILEGSVRKSGTKVRITAQLINAETDKHLWSETYDRELDDIFKVQDEIAAAIVDALKEALGIELVKTETTVQRINPQAYDYYLKGLKDLHSNTFDSLAKAILAFESAIKIAPDFLTARIKLAETFSQQITTGSRYDTEILNTADEIIDQVLAVNPDSADAYFVKAWIADNKNRQDLARKYTKAAYRLNPNSADIIYNYASYNNHDIGEAKTKSLFNQAQQMDPLNAEIPYFYGYYLKTDLQAYSDAERAYKQAIKINPINPNYYAALSGMYNLSLGNLVEAIKVMEIALKLDPNDPDGPMYLSIYYLSLGDELKSLEYADKAIALNTHNVDAIYAKVNVLIYMGQTDEALTMVLESLDNSEMVYRRVRKSRLLSRAVYILLQDNKLAESEALINQHFPDVAKLVDKPLPKTVSDIGKAQGLSRDLGIGVDISLLSTVYSLQGKSEQAKQLAERLNLLDETFFIKGQVKLMPGEYIRLAEVATVQNNNEKAITYLEAAVDNGYLGNWRTTISHSPYFLTLKQYPRFIALIKRLEAEMDRQRTLIENDLAVAH